MEQASFKSHDAHCKAYAWQDIHLKKDQVHPIKNWGKESFLLVMKGLVMSVSLGDGNRRQVLGFHRENSVIALHNNAASPALQIAAIETSRISLIEAADLCEAIKSNSDFARVFVHHTLSGLAASQNALLRTTCPSAETRVAAFLLEQVSATLMGETSMPTLILPMRRIDIADHIGVRTETLCRVLANWRQKGLITTQGRHNITLVQPEQLKGIAGQGATIN